MPATDLVKHREYNRASYRRHRAKRLAHMAEYYRATKARAESPAEAAVPVVAHLRGENTQSPLSAALKSSTDSPLL